MKTGKCLGVTLAILVNLWPLGPLSGRAGTVAWTSATSGDWSADANWTAGAQPIVGDTAQIGKALTVTVSQAGEKAGTLSVGNTTANGSVLRFVEGGELTLDSSAVNAARIGVATSSGHKLTMEGGTLNVLGGGVAGLQIATVSGGSASVEQSGGTVNIGLLRMVYASDYTMSGGVLNIDGTGSILTIVGHSGTAAFTQSGASTVNVAQDLYLAYTAAGGNGTYTLHGGRLTVGRELRMRWVPASNQYGTFNLTGGEAVIGTLYGGSPYDGPFNWTGGTLDVTTVRRSLTNGGGILTPGGDTAVGTTTFAAAGDYVQSATGVLRVSIQDAAQYDRVDLGADALAGNATLAGALQVVELPGAVIRAHDAFDVLTADSISDGTTLAAPADKRYRKAVVTGGNGQILRLTRLAPAGTVVLLQ